MRLKATKLARVFEVSARTIYRDVDALSAAGVPVYAERGVDGGIVLADSYRDALARFDEGELQALFVSSDDVLADVGLMGRRSSALRKLAGSLSARTRGSVERVRSRVHIDARGWSRAAQPSALLGVLREAVWNDRRVVIAYRDRHGTNTQREVECFGLVAKAGIWYLVARDVETIKSFRVGRIESALVLDSKFDRPKSFDIAEYWKSFGTYLAADRTRYVVTARMDDRAFANCKVYLSVESSERVSDARWLVRIIFPTLREAAYETFGWQSGATVVEPQELRERLVERARDVLARYDESPESLDDGARWKRDEASANP